MTPNINISTRRDQHRSCLNRDSHPALVAVGDVRRCPHGHVQIAYRRYRNITGCYWRDLSPVWTPVLYRRARRALG